MHSSERSTDVSHLLVSRDERGQGLAEYALILAFIAVVRLRHGAMLALQA